MGGNTGSVTLILSIQGNQQIANNIQRLELPTIEKIIFSLAKP